MMTHKNMFVNSQFFSLNSFFERKIPLRLHPCLYVQNSGFFLPKMI